MKNFDLKRFAILVCILSICFMTRDALAIKKPSNAKDNYLSVRESMLPMFSFAFRFKKYFPIHRINPDVRPYIIFYLEKDNSNYDYIAGGLWLLGVVGQEEDIQFIDRYIQSFLKSPDYKHHHPTIVAGASGEFAGMMMKRSIKGAEHFFLKYGKVTAWMPPKESPETMDAARRDYSYFIMGAYQYSKADLILPLLRQKSPGPHPFSHESCIDALEQLKTDKYTEMMKPGDTSEETLKKYRMDFLNKNPHWIDMLMRKQTYSQWRKAQEKQKPALKTKRRTTDSIGNFELSETIEGGYLKSIGKEAAKAYGKVSNTLLDRNTKDLPIKKQLLQDIRNAGLNKYYGFYVKIDVEAKVNDDISAVIKEDESADVVFNIQDTADIYKKHASGEVNDSIALSTAGDVEINMKKTKNKWHWDPASDTKIIAGADIVEDNYLKTSVRDALVAYKKITRMLIDGNYDLKTIPVVDDGRLIPQKKRERQNDEMAKALDRQKKVLKEIAANKLDNYGDYRVKVELEATLSNSSVPSVVKGHENTMATFLIRDAGEMYIKHVSINTTQECIDETGNLQVSMKRINGKWYWNPFGW